MNLSISIKKTIYWLFGVILALNGFGLFLRVMTHFLGVDINEELLRLFDTAEEANTTAWFSSVLLLMAGAMLLMIARVKSRSSDSFARHWNILAWAFFILSMDEIVGLHEELIQPLRNATGAGGVFYFAWVIVALPLLLM